MSERTGIAWTDMTWSPWRGCARVSAGCENCYAEALAKRFPKIHGEWGANGTRVMAADASWENVRRWNRKAGPAFCSARIFPSMCDPFEDHPTASEVRPRFFQLIETTPNLMWLLLTKRPQNVLDMVPRGWIERHAFGAHADAWPPNCAIGVTCEDQRRADDRIPLLLRIPAPLRFLSVEPQLENMKILGLIMTIGNDVALCQCGHGHGFDRCPNYGGVSSKCHHVWCKCTRFKRSPWSDGIHWVINGGESGPHARPFNVEWARSLRKQCVDAGIPYFFKQAGSAYVDAENGVAGRNRVPAEHDGLVGELRHLTDRHGADPAEWPDDMRVQEVPNVG